MNKKGFIVVFIILAVAVAGVIIIATCRPTPCTVNCSK